MTAPSTTLSRQGHPTAPRFRVALTASEPLLYGLIGFVLVLAVWEAAVDLGLIRAALMSSPTRIGAAAVADMSNGILWPHVGTSLLEWAVGFAVALVFAIPLGLALGAFRKLEYFVDPWLSALYATPTVALVPLIILLFGVGLPSKFAVVFLETFVVLVVSTVNGTHAADKRHLDTARSFGAARWFTFRSVVIPSSVPFIITGLRIASGRAIVGVIVAEFIAANIGIGFYISINGTTLNASRVMFGVLLIGLFGMTIGWIVRRLERRFDAWRPGIH
ncbi:MAG TPA: ABC transporter permease [Candidatus Limnocylindrales bacterium]|nr:ABC transporter permease [Candidatus Limnocylindrales bacterium]